MKTFLYLFSLFLVLPSLITSLDSNNANSQSSIVPPPPRPPVGRRFCQFFRRSCQRYCRSQGYAKYRFRCFSCRDYSCRCFRKYRLPGDREDRDQDDDREVDVTRQVDILSRGYCQRRDEGDLAELQIEESETDNNGKKGRCKKLYARCMKKDYDDLQESFNDDDSDYEDDGDYDNELTANDGERKRKDCKRLYRKCQRKYDDDDEKEDGRKDKD